MAEVIVVHGPPGSGKTTHCRRVVQEGLAGRHVRHISLGDQLRAIKSHAVHSEFSEYLTSPDAPVHISDEIADGIVFEALKTPGTHELILIDGYPRFPQAVDIFCRTLETSNLQLRGVVTLDIGIDESTDRVLSRGRRSDDTLPNDARESHARFMYHRYETTTHIALLALSQLVSIERVNANRDKDDVYADFTAALGRLALQRKSSPDQ